MVGAAALGLPLTGRNRTPADSGGGLEKVLYHSAADVQPVPLATLRTAVNGIRGDFQNARYGRIAASLPALIATATATRDHADAGERATASTLLADVYITAASFMVKLNDDPLAWTSADRALQAAQAGEDPLTLAEARRSVATVLRHAAADYLGEAAATATRLGFDANRRFTAFRAVRRHPLPGQYCSGSWQQRNGHRICQETPASGDYHR
jgi:hypothetical protein